MDVAVLDDCQLVFHGIAAILRPFVRRVELISLADGGDRSDADVTLWDPATTSTHHQAAGRRVVGHPGYGRVVLYSMRPPAPLIAELLQLGCVAFVDKAEPAERLIDAVLGQDPRSRMTAVDRQRGDLAARGAGWPGKERGLSRREAQILALVSEGLTNTDISAQLYLSINTVKSYIRSAYRKLGFTRRVEAVRWGMENGFHLIGRTA